MQPAEQQPSKKRRWKKMGRSKNDEEEKIMVTEDLLNDIKKLGITNL